jgi:hypothetical protein
MANEGIITLNDLQTKFRAAGIYTVYRDNTANPATRSSPILRLVVGYSKYGISNVPVYIEQGDVSTAEALFGRLDKSLERKGSFFHRSLFTSLEDGPVLALNLLKTDDTVDGFGQPTPNTDVVPYKSFSVDIAANNGTPVEKLYSSFYDKERFWKPSPSYLLATRNVIDKGSIFNLVNLSQAPLSFIIRKSNVKGFNITVKEWYGEDENVEIPKMLKSHDLISDYFVDVIAVRGDFGSDKYAQLAIDPVFGKYFDASGLKVSELDNFLSRTEVKVVQIFTGSIIPNFRDKNGTSQYIETIINRQTRLTGILAAIDKKELDKFEDGVNTREVDMVGHRLLTENVVNTDFLSYKKKIKQDLTYSEKTTNSTDSLDNDTGLVVTPSPANQKITVVIQSTNPTFANITADVSLGTLFAGVTTVAGTSAGIAVSNPVLKVTRILKTPTQITMDVSSPLKDGETSTSGSFIDLVSLAPIVEVLATADITVTGGGDYQQAATGDITVTASGTGGDTITAKINNGVSDVILGSYVVIGGDSASDVATGLSAAINLGTGTHGYSSSPTAAVVTITAILANGASANSFTITPTIVGSNGLTGTSDPTFSGGVTGSIIEAYVNNGLINTLIGSYTFLSGNTNSDVATGLSAAINLGTGTHGYSSSPAAAVVTVSAPVGSGASANSYVPSLDVSIGTTPLTGTTSTTFTLGVTGVGNHFTYEKENNKFFHDGTLTWSIAEPNSAIYADFKSGELTNGDKITDGIKVHYVKGTYLQDSVDYRDIIKIEYFSDSDLLVPISGGQAITFGTSLDSNGFGITDPIKLNFISLIGTLNERFDATSVDAKTVRLNISLEPNIKIGQYLVGFNGEGTPILTRILSVRRIGSPIPTEIEVITGEAIKVFTTTGGQTQIERYLPLTSFFDRYNLTSLKGFTLKESHQPNNTNERMKEIQSVMTDTNMFDALIDPEMIDFRYYIDTFNHGLEPQSKRHLARLCLARQKCLGILNTPSLEEFRESQSPRFTNTPTAANPFPTLNAEYILAGGNLDESPDFLYTLPEEEDGASHVGFFFSNILTRDDDGDTTNVPPAALVGNKFMQKYRGGNPFLPVAGPRRGILTGNGLVGVEYPLTKPDRGALEQKGINPIFQKRNGDIQIMGNETAYKRFTSVLNNLNTRDTLITLTIDIENILNNFTFEFNDDALKTEITSLLDNYLSSIQNGFGAIVDYDIVFDRNNNPGWVVKENAAIVDVIVEPADVVKKFVNRITLKKDSTPSLGGFLSV